MSEFNDLLRDLVGVMVPSPNEEEVLQIAERVANLKYQNLNTFELRKIVKEVCPDSLYGLFEGVDNSTVNTALLVAIQAAAKKLKNRS